MTLDELVEELKDESPYAGFYDLECSDGVEVIDNKPVDQSRWGVHYRAVVKYGGKFYELTYEEPATEMQEKDFDPTIIEVEPVEVTVTKYVPVKKDVKPAVKNSNSNPPPF